MQDYNKLLYVFKNAIIEPNTQFLGKGSYLFKISKSGIIYHYRKIKKCKRYCNRSSYKGKYLFIGISYNSWFCNEGFGNSFKNYTYFPDYQWLELLLLYIEHCKLK